MIELNGGFAALFHHQMIIQLLAFTRRNSSNSIFILVKHIVAVKTFTVVEADHTERVKSPSALREHVRRSLMSVETPKSPRQTVSSSFIKMLLGFISLKIFEICKAFKR